VHDNNTYSLEKLVSINDLGVIFDSSLSFKDHISHKINKAYNILGIIKRNFIFMDESSFILLYKSMVCPHLEYANSVWCPHKLMMMMMMDELTLTWHIVLRLQGHVTVGRYKRK